MNTKNLKYNSSMSFDQFLYSNYGTSATTEQRSKAIAQFNGLQKTIFETGATSHAVNALILFTDNTRELAELRDSIYESMYQMDLIAKSTSQPTNWDNTQFNKLLNKARALYANEFGGDNSLHIINMKDSEKEEYRILYLSDFDTWKTEHGYK